jgi:hypothetical protein
LAKELEKNIQKRVDVVVQERLEDEVAKEVEKRIAKELEFRHKDILASNAQLVQERKQFEEYQKQRELEIAEKNARSKSPLVRTMGENEELREELERKRLELEETRQLLENEKKRLGFQILKERDDMQIAINELKNELKLEKIERLEKSASGKRPSITVTPKSRKTFDDDGGESSPSTPRKRSARRKLSGALPEDITKILNDTPEKKDDKEKHEANATKDGTSTTKKKDNKKEVKKEGKELEKIPSKEKIVKPEVKKDKVDEKLRKSKEKQSTRTDGETSDDEVNGEDKPQHDRNEKYDKKVDKHHDKTEKHETHDKHSDKAEKHEKSTLTRQARKKDQKSQDKYDVTHDVYDSNSDVDDHNDHHHISASDKEYQGDNFDELPADRYRSTSRNKGRRRARSRLERWGSNTPVSAEELIVSGEELSGYNKAHETSHEKRSQHATPEKHREPVHREQETSHHRELMHTGSHHHSQTYTDDEPVLSDEEPIERSHSRTRKRGKSYTSIDHHPRLSEEEVKKRTHLQLEKIVADKSSVINKEQETTEQPYTERRYKQKNMELGLPGFEELLPGPNMFNRGPNNGIHKGIMEVTSFKESSPNNRKISTSIGIGSKGTDKHFTPAGSHHFSHTIHKDLSKQNTMTVHRDASPSSLFGAQSLSSSPPSSFGLFVQSVSPDKKRPIPPTAPASTGTNKQNTYSTHNLHHNSHHDPAPVNRHLPFQEHAPQEKQKNKFVFLSFTSNAPTHVTPTGESLVIEHDEKRPSPQQKKTMWTAARVGTSSYLHQPHHPKPMVPAPLVYTAHDTKSPTKRARRKEERVDEWLALIK